MGLCSSSVGDGYRPGARRLLLLGPGGVGKSTLVKQVKLHHAGGFDDPAALAAARGDVRTMLYETMRALIKSDLVRKALQAEGQAASDQVLDGFATPEDTAPLLALIEAHWRTDAVRSMLAGIRAGTDNERFLDTNEWIQFWLDESARVLAPDYVVTKEDILKLRRATTGVHEQPFEINNKKFVMVDVGGQATEMHAWVDELQKGITGVIFIVSLADFDRVGEDKDSRLLDAFALLDEILQVTPAIQETPLVVMLNKVDLFREKIGNGANFFRTMSSVVGKDEAKTLARKARMATDRSGDVEALWLASQICDSNDFIKSPHGKAQCFTTCATDISQAQTMITSLVTAIVETNMAQCGFLGDDDDE